MQCGRDISQIGKATAKGLFQYTWNRLYNHDMIKSHNNNYTDIDKRVYISIDRYHKYRAFLLRLSKLIDNVN